MRLLDGDFDADLPRSGFLRTTTLLGLTAREARQDAHRFC